MNGTVHDSPESGLVESKGQKGRLDSRAAPKGLNRNRSCPASESWTLRPGSLLADSGLFSTARTELFRLDGSPYHLRSRSYATSNHTEYPLLKSVAQRLLDMLLALFIVLAIRSVVKAISRPAPRGCKLSKKSRPLSIDEI